MLLRHAELSESPDILTPVLLKILVAWDITPSQLVSSCRGFKGRKYIHLQGHQFQQEGK